MTLGTLLAGFGAAAAVLYLLAFCWAGASTVKSLVKTAAVGALALAAWIAGAPVLLALALTLGALGDFFLSREGARAFLAGLVAFAAAHLAFVPLFLTTDGWSAAHYASWRGAAVIAFGLFAVWLARRLLPRTGDLKPAVAVYVAIIYAMVATALGLPQAMHLAIFAAGLFALSDTVLSAELFILDEDHPARRWTPYVIWATYWSAQALFLYVWL